MRSRSIPTCRSGHSSPLTNKLGAAAPETNPPRQAFVAHPSASLDCQEIIRMDPRDGLRDTRQLLRRRRRHTQDGARKTRTPNHVNVMPGLIMAPHDELVPSIYGTNHTDWIWPGALGVRIDPDQCQTFTAFHAQCSTPRGTPVVRRSRVCGSPVHGVGGGSRASARKTRYFLVGEPRENETARRRGRVGRLPTRLRREAGTPVHA
jgi:hypothetical protein